MRKVDAGQVRPSSKLMTVSELLDLYLDGIDAGLAPKTRFDYRIYCDSYIRPTPAPGRSGTSLPTSSSPGSAS